MRTASLVVVVNEFSMVYSIGVVADSNSSVSMVVSSFSVSSSLSSSAMSLSRPYGEAHLAGLVLGQWPPFSFQHGGCCLSSLGHSTIS